jgi:hypothetical protein
MFRRRDRREKADGTDETKATEAEAPLDEEQGDQPEDMSADLDSQAADYLADNDIWMYGPSAEDVVEILDRLEEITPKEARPLAEAWLEIPKSDRDHARKSARKLTENEVDLTRYLQLAREAVGTWMSVTGPFPEFVNADPDWPRVCSQAGEAAMDAAMAVILEGKLDEAEYESLLEPWSETMAQLDAASEAEELEGGKPDMSVVQVRPAETSSEDDEDEGEDEEKEEKFGPNSDLVKVFLNRLWMVSPEQVGLLVSRWQSTPRASLKSAHEALKALVEKEPEWRNEVRKAQEELSPWLNGGRIEETSGFLGQTGQSESRKMAGPALADAVAALVLGDLLERRDAETLYGPWITLIGVPPLPVAADQADTAEKPAKATKGAKAKNASDEIWAKPAPKAAKTAPAAKSAPTKAPAGGAKPKTTDKSTRK